MDCILVMEQISYWFHCSFWIPEEAWSSPIVSRSIDVLVDGKKLNDVNDDGLENESKSE